MTVRLVIFDLDGTLLRGDTVCLALARRLGKASRMLEFEALTDFELIKLARYEMAEWYWPVPPESLIEWLGDLKLAPGAERGCDLLREFGIEIGIASMTWEFAVARFAQRLGASYWTGTTLDLTTWEIKHSSPQRKAEFLRSTMERLELRPEQVAAVGDSSSDLEMLRAAGRRFFVGATRPDIEDVVHLPGGNIAEIAGIIAGHRTGA